MAEEWNPKAVFIPKDWRDRYLSVEQAAAIIGDSPKTLYNRNSRGDGPIYYRIGRKCKYLGRELEDWIRSDRGNSAP